MRSISYISKAFFITIIFLILLFTACHNVKNESTRNLDFNQGWRFVEGSLIGAEAPEFNDNDWRFVDLPHDWSMEDYIIQDSFHIGPFSSKIPLGHDVGYLRGGTGWYRKELVFDERNAGKEVLLLFDGVMSEMQLWVNGHEVGEHVYGYSPFYFNITKYLNQPDEKNIIAIRVDKPNENSRWFTGAGIYRSVEISYLAPTHIGVWGLGVHNEVTDNMAYINLDLEIDNFDEANKTIEIHTEILPPTGESQLFENKIVNIPAGMEKKMAISGRIENPMLWRLDNPVLYKAKVQLYENKNLIDEYVQEFGIRTIDYSVEAGLLINGENILLKGACMHHDNGLLGTAAFKRAEERKVQIMKNNGYNAIRTSHNPPSKYFLEACDRLGMLVIDEAFDMWIKPKRKNDYHQYFEKWWKTDLESMVKRDRNHPSVVMWSFGNEVPERADSTGVVIGKNCISTIRSIDDTRPITQAVCGFWDNPGKVWDDSAPAFEMLDISGYNYQWANYETDHKKYPDRIMYGSESVPKEAFDNWQLVKKLPYVIGDFVWTGMDYIGESGIGYAIYPIPGDERIFLMPWPTYISWCGDIDIIGNKKPQSYYRDVIWGESNLEILVHEPNTSGNQEVTSFWGWPNELPSWNWEGHERELLDVNVYSTYPNVRLELNGKIIQEKPVSAGSRFTATFKVPYAPGVLKAVGIESGEEKDVKIIRTTGSLATLNLIPERNNIAADRSSIIFIQVEAFDENGFFANTSDVALNVAVHGEGKLLAAGNANPKLEGSFQDEEFRLFRGKGLIIVRSTGRAGHINITVKTKNRIEKSIDIVTNN